MEEQTNSSSVNEDTLLQILEELKTLNKNVSEYQEYIYKRNEESDKQAIQKAEQEQKALQESAKAQEQEDKASESVTDATLSKLSDIHSVLSDFDSTYKEAYTQTSAINDNLEFNSNMQFVISGVGVGLLALLLGFVLARMIFRKL